MSLADENGLRVPAAEFPQFSELPPELREEIWKLCLPERVCKLDTPADRCAFVDTIYDLDGPWPCKLRHTTEMNRRPPLIARVCHESRTVAFRAGKIMSGPRGGQWLEETWSANDVENPWYDSTRDLVHLNWNAIHEAEYNSSDGSPLHCVAWAASDASRGGSLTFGYLKYLHDSRCVSLRTDYRNNTYNFPPLLHFKPGGDGAESSWGGYERPRYRDRDALGRLLSWRVVMQIYVIHLDGESAAATGLFGLLGDAPVQIVDLPETDKIDGLFELAKECEDTIPHAIKQNFHRNSLESMQEKMKDAIMKQFQSEELVASMRPTIMFRLCTRMCDRLNHERDQRRMRPPPQASSRQGKQKRGRGRGSTSLRLLG